MAMPTMACIEYKFDVNRDLSEFDGEQEKLLGHNQIMLGRSIY